MADRIEKQEQQSDTLHDQVEGDPLLVQSQQIDELVSQVRAYAADNGLRPEEVIKEIFSHEVNNMMGMLRHGLLFSDAPLIPEEQWGGVTSPERARLEAQLSQFWPKSNERVRRLTTGMYHPYDHRYQHVDIDALFNGDVQGIYIGLYMDADMLYPQHTMDARALQTIMKGVRNVMDVFTVPVQERAALLTEISQSHITIGDFMNIFPDKYLYLLQGDVHRLLNQFEINILFEMLHNAKKYKISKDAPIEIYVNDTGQIDVKNHAVECDDFAPAEIGRRGATVGQQNGQGFGIFKMKAIAEMTGEKVEYTTETPPFVVTCSLKKAA